MGVFFVRVSPFVDYGDLDVGNLFAYCYALVLLRSYLKRILYLKQVKIVKLLAEYPVTFCAHFG